MKLKKEEPKETRLRELARVIRSKNAGPFLLTLDVLFPTIEAFERVKGSGVINVANIAKLYRVPPETIEIILYPPGLAFKIIMVRPIISGDITDTDVYGGQQQDGQRNARIAMLCCLGTTRLRSSQRLLQQGNQEEAPFHRGGYGVN
jgi:hypothetical protein